MPSASSASVVGAPNPPDPGMQPAMARVWELYDGAYEEIQVQIRERLATHPAFGRLIRETPIDAEQDAVNRALVGAAMLNWEWNAYWDRTRAQAAGYANAEIPLASWIELVNLFRADLLERVFAASEQAELLANVQAMDRWLDDVTAAFAQAFVSANEQVIARQQQAIRQLSTPVLQLRSGLLILPIVGALDRERLDQMRALLLQAIRDRRARAVVLDVTGVPEIDSVAANQLIGSVTSARMMGAEVIISGLSAEISETLVTVGIDLARVVSAGDLQGGIELAEARLRNGRQRRTATDASASTARA
jgi:anti-anti-sigma factor